jgi:integrase
MRSGEVTQLRVEDVSMLFGVPVLRVHDRYGSIKNRFSQRDVPLHPRCEDLVDYARSVRGPWLFDPANWRSDRFQRHASVFLRTKARLADRALTMHSLRHTWRTLAREIGMPASVSRAIMGHSMGRDVHEAYGAGPSLRLMADWMARIDPLALSSTSLPRADAQSPEFPLDLQRQQGG